jgi:predicted alpha/beta-hydrolase family hydrolase
MATTVRTISTDQGDARIHLDRARRPVATLVLGHGAGRGEDSPDLVALAATLPRQGISVFRIEQPWHVAGKKVAARPESLDEACRSAKALGAVGCLALAFPLHPPGRPERTRLPELVASGVPTFVVQGERDTFGSPDAFPEDVELTAIPDADHSFRVPKKALLSQEETYALIVEAVVEWVTARVA